MSGFWFGVQTVFAAVGGVVVVAGLSYSLLTLLARLWRWAPAHWWVSGPGRARQASRLYRVLNVRGGHASTVRRLLRVGPWGLHLIRYRPGSVENPNSESETIP